MNTSHGTTKERAPRLRTPLDPSLEATRESQFAELVEALDARRRRRSRRHMAFSALGAVAVLVGGAWLVRRAAPSLPRSPARGTIVYRTHPAGAGTDGRTAPGTGETTKCEIAILSNDPSIEARWACRPDLSGVEPIDDQTLIDGMSRAGFSIGLARVRDRVIVTGLPDPAAEKEPSDASPTGT